MFRNAIEIMLQNIRSEREGIWKLHLSSVSAMLPLIFITNRINYSRWLPVYLLDMFNLPPEVVSKYESGNFAIRQKPSDFNGIWSDMAREKAVIKDSKGYGGIVNITRHKSTLIRWSLTRHVLADVSAEMRQRYRISALADKMMHEESTPTCLKRDEEHVKLLVDQIHQRMTDPFDVLSHPKPLINISTGMHVSREIESSLINASDGWVNMAKSFVNGTFSEGQGRDFYDPITRSKLNTFEDLTKKQG